MRQVVGTALLAVGLIGFVATQALPHVPAAFLQPVVAIAEGQPEGPTTVVATAPRPHDITRLVIASIGLDTPVSPAPLVDHDGVKTWDVPRFVAGHAEGSVGAGQRGNAILIGHVTSLTLGNVFEHLNAVAPGDLVEIYGVEESYVYRATEVTDVARTDLDVLAQTPKATLTLITCSGAWLPTLHDYSQRLIVRAELSR